MAIAFVKNTDNGKNGVGTSPTPLNNTITAATGNLLVVTFTSSGTGLISSVTDSAGNTYIQVPGAQATVSPAMQGDIWYAQNITGGTLTISVTVSTSVSNMEVVFTEFSGASLTQALVVGSGAVLNNQSGAPISPSLTTTHANQAIVTASAGNAVNLTGANSPFTGFANGITEGGATAYYIDPNVETINAVFTPTTSQNYWGTGAVFQAPVTTTPKKWAMELVF